MPKPSDINFVVSERELKATYWYLTHQRQLRRLVIILLITTSVLLYGYSLWRTVQLFVIEGPAYQAMLDTIDQPLIDTAYFHELNRPEPIQLVGVDFITSTDSRYDVVAQLRNTNTKWMTRPVTLELISNGVSVAEQTVFIYPGQERFGGFFGIRDINPLSATVRIKDTAWKRVYDYNKLKDEYLNFVINDVTVIPANSAAAGGRLPSSSLHFTITNATAYSYWNVGLTMVLLSGDQVGAASYFAVDQFKAGETRAIDVRWPQDIPPIFDTRIQPEVDVYATANYMPPQ
jgi:hypothetical protein